MIQIYPKEHSYLTSRTMITEQEIKSVHEALKKVFPTTPSEVIEDVMGDQTLFMIEKGYKMSAGNLFTLSRYRMYKEIKKMAKVASYDSSHANAKIEFDSDRYERLKDGTADMLVDMVEDSERFSVKHM